MADYTPHVWENFPSTNTPINASRLNEMEDGIVGGNAYATTSAPGQVELATQGEMDAGDDTTLVPSVAVIATYVANHGGGGTGTATSVVVTSDQGDVTVDADVDGLIDLRTVVAPLDHVHSVDDITSGLFSIARMPGGYTMTIDKAKGWPQGTNAGNWPSSRPSSRLDITVIWKGNTDPAGSGPIFGDEWKVTP